LTILGSSTVVIGWTPDSQKILLASTAGQPFNPLTQIYTIAPEGGQPEKLPVGPARSIAYGPEGGVVIGRRTVDLANWKRYRGGTAGDIWLDIQGKGKFKPLVPDWPGNVACPLWLGDRIYFLSDHEGIANIYSCTPAGKDVQRHTHHKRYYARNPASDGHRIVYRAGADLFILDPADTKSKKPYQKINIEWHSPQVQRNRKFVNGAAYLEHYTLHPKGHSVAFNARGKSFTMSNWEGAAIQQGQGHGIRYRLTEWLSDGQRLITVSDASGEDRLELHTYSAKIPTQPRIERLEGLDIGRPLFLAVSPTDDAVVLGNHRYELLHLDLKSKVLKQLDSSNHGRINKAVWSPDGRWVAYSLRTSFSTAAIKLCQLETGQTHFVTTPNRVYDFGPSFDPAGRYLYFISQRDFNPVGDSHYFELSFPHGRRPYLVTLQKDLPNPFIPLPNGQPAPEKDDSNDKKDEKQDKKDKKDKKKEKKEGKQKEPDQSKERPPLPIDLEDIQNRVVAFPVPEGRYFQIEGINKGKILFTSFPVEGELGGAWLDQDNPPKGSLEVYDLPNQKKEFLLSGLHGFDVSRDRNFIIYHSLKRVRVLKAGEKPDNGASGFNKKNGWINLNRAKIAINPPDEWRQMFREAWRLQRDHFWTEDMSSVDWALVYERYYPLVDRIATRSEFSDLMWEMQGELGTSHAYEFGGDYRTSPRYQQGFLGADFVYDAQAKGYRITHIVQGDSWLEKVDSPLNRLGVNAKVGDVLLAIDGQPLSEAVPPQQLLVNQANTEIQLTLLSPNGAEPQPSKKKKDKKKKKKKKDQAPPAPLRNVLVKTLSNERMARYREWVESNRQRVHTETGGKVGYVHVPDMGAFGYSEFHRYYLAESEREGLIVDVRFNGGGNVSQLLLEKLARRRVGYDKPRYGEVAPYPSHSVLGPIVVLTNEFAGSDGDIFSHAFKLLGLGPLIGKRTWGGVIGIWPRHFLVDGTITTQPEFSHWFEDVGWAVENYGTDPDIEVEITPQDYAKGQDPQLKRGLKEIQKLMKKNPPRVPDFGPPPNLALPKLPKVKRKKK
jgi:tricorn protease